MLTSSNTYKTLTIHSPKNAFKRNHTFEDNNKWKSFYKDKESMFEEIQQLKQDKNMLQLSLRKLQSQLQYFKKEVTTVQKDDCSPSRNYLRLKQGYLERLTTLEEENSKLKQQLQETQDYLKQLKNSMDQSNIEILCMRLSDDNVQLTRIVEQLEKSNKNLEVIQTNIFKESYSKLKIKFNATQIYGQKLKVLNNQLLQEIGELKKKHLFQDNKPSQRETFRMDEKVTIELEQAKIEIRNLNQKIKYWESKFNNQVQEDQERIEYLENKNKETHRQLVTLELQYESDKQQYQQMQLQSQQQRFLRRTVIMSKPQIIIEDNDQEIKEIKKNITVSKNDVLPIARKIKLRLIGNNCSLSDAEHYLITNNELTLQCLEQNLRQNVFGLEDPNELHLMATYLADIESEEESTTSQRVRSIFRTLMENYTLLTHAQQDHINQVIQQKRSEINDYVVKKYPETFSNGYMSIDQYLEILSSLEIRLSKIEIDHVQSLMTKHNKGPRILLQQIYAPFYIPEINEPHSDEDELPNLLGENPLLSENPMQSENPLYSQMDVSVISGLDIKMCNSQELRKKSQSELPQF